VMDTFRRIRRYHDDGIINHDILNVDKKTALSLFGSGKFAAGVAATDGLQTSSYGATTTNIAGSAIEMCVPFAAGAPKPYSVFGASNHLAFNARGGQLATGLKFLDWLSVRENHDLLQYGVQGVDWNPVGEDQYEPLGRYVFPGYTMSWRVPLERTPKNMMESERKWFAWSQKFDSFELSPLAGFAVDQNPVKSELAQFSAASTRYLKPLQAGTVDVAKGIEEVKRGFTAAGLSKVVAEVEKQLGEFFKTRSQG
jgi:putative aldouronate transport system substrate-binding protein